MPTWPRPLKKTSVPNLYLSASLTGSNWFQKARAELRSNVMPAVWKTLHTKPEQS